MIFFAKRNLIKNHHVLNNEKSMCLHITIQIQWIFYFQFFCFAIILIQKNCDASAIFFWFLWVREMEKNLYRIRIKVRWCIESSLQKIFWKFIQHTHLQTPSHFRTLPHTPMHTRAYHTHPPNHTHIHVCTFACTCARPCTPAHTQAHLSTPEHTRAHPHTSTHPSTHPCISHTYPLMPLTW